MRICRSRETPSLDPLGLSPDASPNDGRNIDIWRIELSSSRVGIYYAFLPPRLRHSYCIRGIYALPSGLPSSPHQSDGGYMAIWPRWRRRAKTNRPVQTALRPTRVGRMVGGRGLYFVTREYIAPDLAPSSACGGISAMRYVRVIFGHHDFRPNPTHHARRY